MPQGSILGPLLFVLNVNDIMNCSKLLQFILFADDKNLFYCNKNYEDLMKNVNSELSKLSEWFRANRLSLKISKTNYILFGNRRKCLTDTQFNIHIDGNTIERVSFTKFLGVYWWRSELETSHCTNFQKNFKEFGHLEQSEIYFTSSNSQYIVPYYDSPIPNLL